jgi:hypothetical protein
MAPSDRRSPLKTRLLAAACALGLAAMACNAIVGLDGFEKDECAHGCSDGGIDADVGTPDAPDDAPEDAPADAPPPPVPIPDGAAAVSWAQWPMPSPEAGPNSFSYKVNADSSVTDNRTGLVWLPTKTAAFGSDLDGFNQARAYCEGLGDAGTKWRLPTRIELVTLIDYSRHDPAVDPNFRFGIGFSGGWYWSSSVVRPPTIPYQFWSVNFTTGEVSNTPPTDPRTALCVKS